MGLSVNWGAAASCFGKGALNGIAGAAVTGVVAVGVVALGAPVAAVTAVLGGAAIVGGIIVGANIGFDIDSGNWNGLAYNVGAIFGGMAFGGSGGRAIARGVNGVSSPPWSLSSDIAQGYNPNLGSVLQWLGTGPNPGSAAVTVGATGAASAGSNCGCQ